MFIIKTFSYSFTKFFVIFTAFLLNFKREIDFDIEYLKRRTVRNSDDYIRLMGMRASMWYIEAMCSPWVQKPIESLTAALERRVQAIEEFRMHKYCILAFLQLDFMLCVIKNLQGFYTKYNNELLALEKLMDDYEKNATEPMWEPIKSFNISPEQRTERFDKYQSVLGLEYLQEQMAPQLYVIYQNHPEPQKQLRYALRVLKQKTPENRETNPFEFLTDVIFVIQNIIDLLLFEGRFKQVDHLLAIAMNNCVKLQTLLPKSQIKTLNETKSKLCFFYAAWGVEIFERSAKEIYNLSRPVRGVIDNTGFIEMIDLMEPGVDIYANQFPIDIVKTHEELSSIVHRAKRWNSRGIDFAPYESLKAGLNKQSAIIKELMDFFD